MRKLLNIFFLTIIITCQTVFAQERLSDFDISTEEQELLNMNGNVVRESREYFDWNNLLCRGVVELVKVNDKIEFNHIGTWHHYYDNGTLRETYIFDNKGNLLKYDFYEEDGFNSYSCTYRVKHLEGSNCRIEHIRVFYPSGNLKEEGYRINTFNFIKGAIFVDSPKKVGVWTYYNKKGELTKQKVKRKALAKRIGIIN